MISKRKNIVVHKTPRHVKKRRKPVAWGRILKKAAFVVALVSFTTLCVWTLLFSQVMRIDTINIANERIDKAEIEQIVWKRLQGKTLNIFPNDNLFFVPTNKVSYDLQQQYKIIKAMEITRVFPKALLIEIKERSSVLVWCQASECFLMDELGTVFYKLKATDEEMQRPELVHVDSRSQAQLSSGQVLLDERSVGFVLELPAKFKQQAGEELEQVITTPSVMSGELKARTRSGWYVYFNWQEPLDPQLGVLNKVIDDKIGKDKLSSVDYIDLRLKGRVVYKMKDDPAVAGEQAEEGQGDEVKEVKEEKAGPGVEEKKEKKKNKKKDT